MKTIRFLSIVASLVFASTLSAEGLKSTNMNNKSFGTGGSMNLTPEQLKSLSELSARSPSSAGQQPQISEEQMAEMMKVLEEYKKSFEKRNDALQKLLKEEDH